MLYQLQDRDSILAEQARLADERIAAPHHAVVEVGTRSSETNETTRFSPRQATASVAGSSSTCRNIWVGLLGAIVVHVGGAAATVIVIVIVVINIVSNGEKDD